MADESPGDLGNEIGTAPGRYPPPNERSEVEHLVSDLIGEEIRFGPDISVSAGPSSCPACGGHDLMWGCDREQTHTEEEIHPLVWHETEWLADSYVCQGCWAGWIEPDAGEEITWVRPYWRIVGSDSSSGAP
ncbi:MAG TPA: hypothetical protein PKE56_05035 [Acidimicrobiales bacterium]|nr:hypothetical protein [Acidimicrobiales bacterium]